MHTNPDVLSRSKIYAHPERLYQWFSTGKTHPITLEIDPSNQCNNNCKGCAGNRYTPKAELSYENMKKVTDETSNFIKGIVFTGGGEPLLNPATPEIIGYAKNKGIDIGLITNGLLLDTRNIEALVKDCTWIRVSLDAADAKTYAQRKGTNKENYEKVWQNISKLIDIKNKIRSKCTIGIAYLTEDEDYETLEKFAKQVKQSEADYVEFRPYHHSRDNLIQAINKTKFLETNNFKIIYPKEKYEKKKFNYKRAFGDEFRFVVSATGDVYPDCFTRGIKKFSYGNILKQSFEEIWTSQKRGEIVSTKLQQENCPPQCYYDSLNQLLWNMYISKKEARHVNFV